MPRHAFAAVCPPLAELLRGSLALGVLLMLACNQNAPPSPQPTPPLTPVAPAVLDDLQGPLFIDETAASGLDFTYRNGEEADHYAILESLGGGIGLIDYDQDGRLDIFCTGGGRFGGDDNKQILGYPNRLFRNLGDWKFADVTSDVGLPAEGPCYSHGVAVCDYDNDGWPDLLLTGYGRLALYRNERGKLRDVTTSAGLDDPGPLHWSTSAGWGDFNGDGFNDLFIAHYLDWSFTNHPSCQWSNETTDLCPPHRFAPLAGALYLNQQGTGFALQREAGIKLGRGLGVVLADIDEDGSLDIYVANDGMENFLYLNRGEGRFEDVGSPAGVAYDDQGRPTGSMGVDLADCDGSGRLSLFVANYEGEEHALYRNLGSANFRYASRTAGIAALGGHLVAFGGGFLDFDRDGQCDLMLANGHVLRHPASEKRKQEAVLLHNLRSANDSPGEVRYSNSTSVGGEYFARPHIGRGVALGDLNDDGLIDLVVSHISEPVAVLRNNAQPTTQWLGVTLRGQQAREAVGAKVTLTQGDARQVQVVKGGGSYLSSGDRRLLFALREQDFQVTVQWPSDQKQTLSESQLARNRYVEIIEPPTSP